jgi:hypothetical protein
MQLTGVDISNMYFDFSPIVQFLLPIIVAIFLIRLKEPTKIVIVAKRIVGVLVIFEGIVFLITFLFAFYEGIDNVKPLSILLFIVSVILAICIIRLGKDCLFGKRKAYTKGTNEGQTLTGDLAGRKRQPNTDNTDNIMHGKRAGNSEETIDEKYAAENSSWVCPNCNTINANCVHQCPVCYCHKP